MTDRPALETIVNWVQMELSSDEVKVSKIVRRIETWKAANPGLQESVATIFEIAEGREMIRAEMALFSSDMRVQAAGIRSGLKMTRLRGTL